MRQYETYSSHDHGRPFLVEDHGSHVQIYENTAEKPLLLKTRYTKLFVGKEPTGNTVLIHISGPNYIHVGSIAYAFSLVKGDAIKSFRSPLGKHDIPAPVAYGKTHTYLLLDEVAIPNELLDFKEDIYQQWYFGDYVQGCAKRMTPWCRAELKNPAAVTRKRQIQERRKTLKVKKLKT
jgi:hypothetical protein